MKDVVVIGAGVIGGAVARELSKYNLSVCILEKCSDVAMGATRANSAIVHAGFDAKEGSLKAKMNVKGSKMMEAYAKELGVKYKKNGSLVVGFSEEDKKTLEELKVRGEINGVEGLEVIGREDILKLEPSIGETVTVALHAPTGAIICPYELCMAEIGNAMDNGAELKLNFDVKKIEKSENGYVIYSDNESIEAKYVVNCAGVYADAIVDANGVATIEVLRGDTVEIAVGGFVDSVDFSFSFVSNELVLTGDSLATVLAVFAVSAVALVAVVALPKRKEER